MDKNPFEVGSYEEEESIDSYMLDIRYTDKLSWRFNPWYHRLPNYFLSLIPRSKTRTTYIDASEIEFDQSKSSRLNKVINSGMNAVKLMLVTKTVKIPLDSEEEACDFIA